MCGACGAAATTWAERVAPLDPRGARRRAAALAELARPVPGGDRVRVHAGPAGALRLAFPGGDVHAGSLPAAAAALTRRLGPLVPGPAPADASDAGDADPASPERVAVWCAAAHAAGVRAVVRTADREIRVGPDGVTTTPRGAQGGGPEDGIGDADPAVVAHWRRWSGGVAGRVRR